MGRNGDMLGVWMLPVTAHVMMTLRAIGGLWHARIGRRRGVRRVNELTGGDGLRGRSAHPVRIVTADGPVPGPFVHRVINGARPRSSVPAVARRPALGSPAVALKR
jgi:hypothetical protein